MLCLCSLVCEWTDRLVDGGGWCLMVAVWGRWGLLECLGECSGFV
jgi:hypothetical protein